MGKGVAFLIASSLLVGCASTTSKYSNFDEFVAGKKKVDVILDTIFLSDLKGKALGFNEEKNAFALNLLREAVEGSIVSLGYEPNLVYSGHGLSFEFSDEIEYFYSENWKSIDRIFDPIFLQSASSGWYAEEMQQYFRSVICEGEEGGASKQDGEIISNKDLGNNVPELINELPSQVLLYIQVEGGIKSTSKKVAHSMLTGALSGLLTGGALFVTGLGEDSHTLKIAAIDRSTNRVVWYQNRATSGFKTVARSAMSSFGYYPLAEGRYMNKKEREVYRKREEPKHTLP